MSEACDLAQVPEADACVVGEGSGGTAPAAGCEVQLRPGHLQRRGDSSQVRPDFEQMVSATAAAVLVPTDDAPAIEQLLQEARRMQLAHTPLFSWDELIEVVLAGGRLGELCRHPSIEKVYAERFNPALRKAHGTVEAYLRQQLQWRNDELEGELPYWTRNAPARVRLNDWAYSVPKDVVHYVVWVPRTLFHADLCRPSATAGANLAKDSSSERAIDLERCRVWERVQQDGLGGMTGTGVSSDDDGPHREILAFVKEMWSEGKFDTLWFANPPQLQSVPGLAHFHVLARPRRKENGTAEEPRG